MTHTYRKLKGFAWVLVLFSLVLSSQAWAGYRPAPADETGPYVPGQILLKVSPGTPAANAARAVGASVRRAVGDGSIHLLQLKESAVQPAVDALNGMPGVVFAEPNWLRELHDQPDDDGYGLKWELNNTGTLCDGSDCAVAGADMDWQEAYTYLGSDFSGTAVVAVIDTGIDAGHPDLDGKITANGYDFLAGDNDPTDTYGHGTHVAGITLAETNNGAASADTDTAGVGYSPNIRVMPLRVCDESGCPTSAIVDAIYYAADNGANVINLSLGGRFGSASEEQAINYAWSQGLVIAASSGNDGSGRVSYPAAFASTMAVGSTNWHDQLAPYSNKGNDLDVVAPGGDMSTYHDPGGIYSTMPTYDVYLTTAYDYSRSYDQLQGTSMAAPQVSGLAALLFAVGVTDANGNGRVNDEIRSIIETTADDLGASGWDRDFGWGRVNVYSAVLAAGGGGGGNTPPTASFTYACNELTCTFDGSGSSDPDGSIATYAWDFGDGGAGSGATTSHAYASAGTYTVVLTVTDNGDASDTQSQDVAVGGSAGTMYVLSIDMSGKTAGPNRSATAVVTIYDATNAPVAGATVTGTWSGADTGSASGVTAGDGSVAFNSGKVRQANATFTFTVDDVTASGYTYDPALNVETSDTVTVP